MLWFGNKNKNKADPVRNSISGGFASMHSESLNDFLNMADGESVAPSKAMQHAAVFGCVQAISRTIGALPIEIIDRKTKHVIADHKYDYMLNVEPNDFFSARDMWEQILIDMLLRGNGYAVLNTNDNGDLLSLFRVSPDRMTVRISDNEKDGLLYEVKQKDGKNVRYQQENILHFKCFGSDNFIGQTPLKYAAGTIGSALRENEFVSKYYKTGGFVRNVLKLGKGVSDEAKAAFKTLFKNRHKGGGENELMILDKDDDYEQLSMSLTDAQTLEARKYSVTEICRFYDVPPMIIGEMQNQATFKFVSDIFIYFFRKTLKPYVEKMEAEMTRKIFGKNRLFNVRFNLSELTRGDPKSRAEFLKAALGGNGIPGYMKIDEARKMENLPPLGDEQGDKVYYPPDNLSLSPDGDDETKPDDESDDDDENKDDE
ncbi:MAG: phage portal protein [Rhizobiales bacterium]|nr:phage portal protein [Hyphomicrobiales bacterium]NRB15034.1 phage portal protein [Hyphomicrobiales bacterium]